MGLEIPVQLDDKISRDSVRFALALIASLPKGTQPSRDEMKMNSCEASDEPKTI